MVRIDVRYEGELRCRATHGPSAAELVTDAPADNHGQAASFSPTDLVASALATCTLTVMGIEAGKRGWDIDGSRASVEKHMVADPRRRIARLEVAFEMQGEHDAEARRVLEGIARSCPVQASLHPDTLVTLRFEWPGTSAV